MTCSEQSGGFVVLIGLAFLIGATIKLHVPDPEPQCWTKIEYDYVGRDENGRPDWNYPERRVCRDE